jgi:hypothetical protein
MALWLVVIGETLRREFEISLHSARCAAASTAVMSHKQPKQPKLRPQYATVVSDAVLAVLTLSSCKLLAQQGQIQAVPSADLRTA